MLDERLERILSRINEIHQDAVDWCPLLAEIGEYLEGNLAAMIEHNFAEGLGGFHVVAGLGAGQYESHVAYHTRNHTWLRNERDYQQGEIYVGKSIAPACRNLPDNFPHALIERQVLHHRLCAVLSRSAVTGVYLEVMRPSTWRQFDQTDVRRCQLLLPLLQCLLRMQDRIAELKRQRDTALHALDHLPWGVILVDHQGRQLAANRIAREVLAAGEGLSVQCNALRAALPEETTRLALLVRQALSEATKETLEFSGAISITRPGRDRPLNVRVMPIRIESETLDDRPQAAIFVSDPDVRPHANERELRQLYALTASEARLAALLASGKSLDEASSAMGVTMNTARAYVKRVYNKTGVHRQSELIRILLLGLVHSHERDTVDGRPFGRSVVGIY
jgi:DNA-binding CsgD family transcriptional regulator/PAS domain-containing protein